MFLVKSFAMIGVFAQPHLLTQTELDFPEPVAAARSLTATRSFIYRIQIRATGDGGYGLFTGCAAGDTAKSVALQVTDHG